MLVYPDEQVCFDARRHGVVLARPLVRAGVLAVFGAVLLALPWPLAVPGAALVAFGAAVCLRAVWLWERTRLVVTTEKVCLVDGTLRRRSSSVRLRTVEKLELEQSLPGRLLGYGTLVAGPLEIEHVPRPRSVLSLVERLAG
jgi:ABC-type cobalamin transport system permease subunit